MSSRKVLIDGVTYIRSRDAAREVHLTLDYVSRLARHGAIAGVRIAGIWFDDLVSLENFVTRKNAKKNCCECDLHRCAAKSNGSPAIQLRCAQSSLLRGALTVYNILTAPRFSATSTTASQLPYASTTAITATNASTTNLTISGVSGSLLKTEASGNLSAAVPGVDYAAAGSTGFATTSADYWKAQRDFFSTTSVGYWQSVTDLFSTTSSNYHLSTYDKGFFFSTTSADAFLAQRNLFSTT
jgi:hypothetical protein